MQDEPEDAGEFGEYFQRARVQAALSDIDKGGAMSPKYRSRLVACELRSFAPWTSQGELYAATPPGAALNFPLSLMVSTKPAAGKHFRQSNCRRTSLSRRISHAWAPSSSCYH